ncbi:MAG: TIGR03862 family flavoprotein [Veillonellales bacterium]
MKTDVLIVGGGPSGLAAAYEVVSRGYKATIVDEAWSLGGQLRQQTQFLMSLPAPWAGLRGFQVADRLTKRLQKYLVEYLLNHEVIGLYADGSVGVSSGEKIMKIEPACTIVATGAAESAVTFPGWTLPGVMTVGAAQILINRERVYPGKTALVVGSSDMALEITRQMHDVGIHIMGVAESADKLLAKDQRIIDSFEKTGIPIFLQTDVTAATGSGKVEEVQLHSRRNSSDEAMKYSVDFLCVDGGRHPILELFSILNCPFQYQQALGGWVPSYSDTLQAAADGVFAAGQAAGVTCQAGVLLTGAIAGIGAVDYLEKKTTEERETARKNYWEQLQKIESCQLPEVWQARLTHIKNYPG